MTDWTAFAAGAGLLTAVLLFLTHRSRRTLDRVQIVGVDEPEHRSSETAADPPRPVLTTRALLANVAVSQALALGVLAALAWWTEVPAAAFGLAAAVATPRLLAVGVVAGTLLYLGNEAAAALARRAGYSPSTRLREAMAPTTRGEWGLLLGVVVPVIAATEEAVFRGALVGALALGLGLDPWLLVAVSSVAFGLGHGAQGALGVAVAALLGAVLGALFVATGSLLAVVVAHYVVDALEFGVREGVGRNPLSSAERPE
ncbi:CPBP family intramembrane glutamic endopeptidase [Haloparvum sedimenti]|uniref:CPBP family intramembrane glutamic endopeptidase n=1 Tax=Haloparvum sedimenti TaxID=1678448 RepID=UPI00071E985D|nr:CPBP family intramembrane glutamic endopeptidase [Haloparvum sedimenti]